MPGRFTLNRMWSLGSVPRLRAPRDRAPDRAPDGGPTRYLTGLKEMDTRASAGSARATLAFHRSVSMDAAYNAVVDRMERAMTDLLFPT